MSYSTTAYLFYGVKLNEEQAEWAEDNYSDIRNEGLDTVHAGDGCSCEPWDSFLAVVVASDEWLEELGPKLPKITREQRKKLTEWRKLGKIKTKPQWYIGNNGG